MEKMLFDNLDELRKYVEFLNTLNLDYTIKCFKQYCAKMKVHYYVYQVNVFVEGKNNVS